MLLYIHIPFCDSKCSYCAFNSYVDKFHLKSDYMKALVVQLEYELKRFKATKQSIKTVFIGGGTPSTIEPKLYEPLFEMLSYYLDMNIEITSEANPNSATLSWLSGMKTLGVNRISFGVQSFDDEKLKLLNRSHNKKQAIDAVRNAKKAGYENISLDIIYATLGDTKELLQNDLNIAFSLPINHLSAYALTIEEATPFESKPEMSSEKLQLTEWFFKEIESHGFSQYEISNFGSYRSSHNLGYWQYEDYIGLGSGAVGKLNINRFYPTISIEEYIENPLKIREERLEQEDMLLERIFLGFRSSIGVKKELFTSPQLQKLQHLIDAKKIYLKDGIYYNNNYLLADEIALYF